MTIKQLSCQNITDVTKDTNAQARTHRPKFKQMLFG